MKKAKFWFKNEKEVMRSLGFEPVKGSGSGWIHKEDGESEFALAQLKSTEAESYKLNYLDLEKLEYHASVSHKLPVFVVQFLNRGTYVMVNVNDLDKLDCLIKGKQVKDEGPCLNVTDIGAGKTIKISSSGKARETFYKERENQWKKKQK